MPCALFAAEKIDFYFFVNLFCYIFEWQAQLANNAVEFVRKTVHVLFNKLCLQPDLKMLEVIDEN